MTHQPRFPPLLVVFLLLSSSVLCAAPPALSPEVQQYVRVQAPTVILTHVRVIDGTGKPAVSDQNVVIENGRIVRIEAASDVPGASGTSVLDLRGYTVIPGIVGMHNHLFYVARPNLEPGKEPF